MGKQVVNTDRISLSASKLRNTNSAIDSAFSALKRKTHQLENNWKSRTADAAKSTLAKIIKNGDERSKVLINYINFLEQQVNTGYINTEDVNTTLADKFK